MEKIKQALEKARREREQGAAGGDRPLSATMPIEYTETRIMHGSEELMRENRLVHNMQSGAYTDALKILSTQTLQRMGENGWTTVMVTSARSGEGRTTIAINLGLSMAREVDYTVLLVDTNLRSPQLHTYFGIETSQGLSDYLSSDISLSEVLVNPQGIDHFVILPGGTPTMSSAEMLGSPKMDSLIEELKSRYSKRMIVFDTPAVLDTADTLNLAPNIDSALLVVEDDNSSDKDLKDAVSMLSNTNVLGTVLNKSRYG